MQAVHDVASGAIFLDQKRLLASQYRTKRYLMPHGRIMSFTIMAQDLSDMGLITDLQSKG